jgi:hypothetical protein
VALKNRHESGEHNFLYAAMVLDENEVANSYMQTYFNRRYTPTLYYDGGHDLVIGGYPPTATEYDDALASASTRAVPNITLDIDVTWLGDNALQIDYTITNPDYTNSAPNNPDSPTGDVIGSSGKSYNYSAFCFDPDYYQDIYLKWDYGDGEITDWLGPYANEEPCDISHSWATYGSYDVKVQAKDEFDLESGWSEPFTVEIYLCGDLDQNGVYDILDIIMLIDHKFKDGDGPTPWQAADTDNNGIVDILDIIVMIDNKFKEGDPPNCP